MAESRTTPRPRSEGGWGAETGEDSGTSAPRAEGAGSVPDPLPVRKGKRQGRKRKRKRTKKRKSQTEAISEPLRGTGAAAPRLEPRTTLRPRSEGGWGPERGEDTGTSAPRADGASLTPAPSPQGTGTSAPRADGTGPGPAPGTQAGTSAPRADEPAGGEKDGAGAGPDAEARSASKLARKARKREKYNKKRSAGRKLQRDAFAKANMEASLEAAREMGLTEGRINMFQRAARNATERNELTTRGGHQLLTRRLDEAMLSRWEKRLAMAKAKCTESDVADALKVVVEAEKSSGHVWTVLERTEEMAWAFIEASRRPDRETGGEGTPRGPSEGF